MNQELEPPGEFSATLAACGSSSTFFVDITDMARLDSNLMTKIVDGGIGGFGWIGGNRTPKNRPSLI